MKYSKLLVLLLILGLSLNASFSIQDVPKDKVGEKIEYSNENHLTLSLKDCVEIAVKNNPEIQASIYNEEIYKSKIGQAWANYFPSINAGVDLSRSRNNYSGSVPDTVNQTQNMGYLPKISADMLLFDFGKVKATADSAKNQYEASKEDTLENINQIIYGIKSTYYNILFAKAQVQVYKDTVKDYQLQLTQAKSFYNLGKKAKIDVVTAEYNLGKAKLNLIKAQNILEVAQAQLSKIMGVPEYTNYELSDELSLNALNITIDDAINLAMEVRPQLVSAQKATNASKLNLRAAKRNFTPDIGIYGSYNNGIGSEYNISSTQIGVGLNYSGFNLLRLKKQVNEASARYKKSMAEYSAIRHNVYLNVKKSYIDLQTDKEAIIIAKLALDQAKEQYRQVTGRYKSGIGDAIELKDGENTYLNARLDFYNALLNYNITVANLEKEIGRPIEFSSEKILNITTKDM